MLNYLARVICFTGLWLFCVALNAEPATLVKQDDIRLIIDISGSMKKNDPENLRVPAVNLLVNLLPPKATAGIWTFGQQVNMLMPYREIDDRWKKTALLRTNKINSTGLYTNIGGALEQVLLSKNPGGTAILLTDGVVDISKDPAVNRREEARIINTLLPRLVAAGALVHTVALSENADEALLQELARSTGGIFDIAYTPDDLTRIFLRMFDDAVKQDRLPMEGGVFSVDSSVEEFTLLAFREEGDIPIQLRSPTNEYYLSSSHPNFVSWYNDSGFELVTVKQPLEGQWQLFANADPQNRVTVLSDLKLQVTNLNNTVYAGDVPTLKISFSNDGELITDKKFLDLMDVQLIVELPDESRVGIQLTDYIDGVFSSTLGVLKEPGRYQIKVSVDGRTFRREMVQELEYQQPVQISYDSVTKQLTVTPAARGLVSDSINVIASVINSADKRRFLPMQLVDGDHWQASLANFDPGEYEVALNIKGTSSTGQYVDYNAKKLSIKIGELADKQIEPVAEDVDVDVVEPDESADILSWIMDNILYLGIGLGNFLIAGLIFWWFKRRSGDDDMDEEDPEIAALLAGHNPNSDAEKEGEDEGGDEGGDEADSESSPEEPESTISTPKGEEDDSTADILEANEPADTEKSDDFGSGLSEIVDAWGDEGDEDVPAPIDEDKADANREELPESSDSSAVETDDLLDEVLGEENGDIEVDADKFDPDDLLDEVLGDLAAESEVKDTDQQDSNKIDPDSLLEEILAADSSETEADTLLESDVGESEAPVDADALLDEILNGADGSADKPDDDADPDSILDDILAGAVDDEGSAAPTEEDPQEPDSADKLP